tara:strand:+ start:196 stop:474 length:279 start_codon:yes stop_codon:yes gene_type:complete
VTKYFILPFEIKRGDKLKMKSFIHSTIRLVISLGKFGILFYTISLASIALNSSDNFRYLKNGSPILKLSAVYIQGEINSNIKRKQRQVLLEV